MPRQPCICVLAAVDKRCMTLFRPIARFWLQSEMLQGFAQFSGRVKSDYSHLWIRLCIAFNLAAKAFARLGGAPPVSRL